MRTVRKISIALILLVGILFTFQSCQKDESDPNLSSNLIENKSYEEQVEYTKQHLLEIGRVVSKLYSNDEFRKSLQSNLNTKNSKDEESVFFIRDMINGELSKNYAFISDDDRIALQNHLDAFENIEGQDWQPQIYLPNYTKLSKSLDITKPIIIPFVVEEEDETYEGYQEDDYGVLQPIEDEISEEFAEAYGNVIIISLSESPDDNYDSGVETSTSTSITDKHSIEYITVKSHKESWVAGASEVAIRGYQYNYNGGQSYSGVNTENYLGKEIIKVSRDDVNGKVKKTISDRGTRYYEDMTYESPFWEGPNYVYYNYHIVSCNVIFESDAWPTGKRTAKFDIPSNSSEIEIKFRSGDSEYSSQSLFFKKILPTETLINNYYENDSDFEYKLFIDNGIWNYY